MNVNYSRLPVVLVSGKAGDRSGWMTFKFFVILVVMQIECEVLR